MEIILTFSIGVVISILGIINMTGNIASLHWYHRQRVTEENRVPFGRLVGLGTLIIGLSLTAFGAFQLIYRMTSLPIFTIIGSVILIAGIVAGLVLNFYAMIKYNKGIF